MRDGLGFGIAERVARDPHAFGSSDPWFLVVEDGDRLLATAVCTPPHRPILACFTDPDDEGPVSTALKTHPARQGVSIGGVYTPPDRRNRGYASSCVAGLCQELLATYAFCVLYTDLANPTSNAIYQLIGIRPHHDSLMITLAPGSSG